LQFFRFLLATSIVMSTTHQPGVCMFVPLQCILKLTHRGQHLPHYISSHCSRVNALVDYWLPTCQTKLPDFIPVILNSFPEHLCLPIIFKGQFQCGLKTHLFQKAYNLLRTGMCSRATSSTTRPKPGFFETEATDF